MARKDMIEGSLFPEEDMQEDNTLMTQEEMREKLLHVKEIVSISGVKYSKMHVTKKMIIGIRESSGKEFTINLDQLYDAYLHCKRLSSPEVKKFIFMGHSPALALLRMLKVKKSI